MTYEQGETGLTYTAMAMEKALEQFKKNERQGQHVSKVRRNYGPVSMTTTIVIHLLGGGKKLSSSVAQ